MPIGTRQIKKYASREFVAAYGLSVQVVARIWLLTRTVIQEFDEARAMQPAHLLWCLYFLKQYGISTVMSHHCGCSDKTFRKWVWLTVEVLAELYEQHVS